ncbi:MAG: protein kinase [Chloroflexota bacterium]|nr:protein kinase [Chloroflexota bacterium]
MRILVADDEETVVQLLEEHFRSEGYDTMHAYTGEEALRLVENYTFDLVLLDLNFGKGMDGYEVIRLLRQQGNDVAVIMISSRSAVPSKVVGFDLGADDYVVKPIDPDELSARVRNILRRRPRLRVELMGEPPRSTDYAQEHVSRWTESPRLQHAIENKFPHMISYALYQLRSIDDWRSEVSQLATLLGITLQYLATVVLSEYLSGTARDISLNHRIGEQLRKPLSYGAWAGLLRDVATFLHKQPQQAFMAPLLNSYFPTIGILPGSSLKTLIDSVVNMRNTLLKRTGGGLISFIEYQQFKGRLLELLQVLQFVKDFPLVSARSTQIKNNIKTHLCYSHMGFHKSFLPTTITSDIDLEHARVGIINPRTSEVLYLYPFYVVRNCPDSDCDSIHLFQFERIGNRGIEYISSEGHQLRDKAAGSDLMMLLNVNRSIHLRYKGKYLYLEPDASWEKLPRGHIIDGKYRVIEHLRRGGMSDVYKVQVIGSSETYAVKLLPFHLLSDHSVMQRFRQEAIHALSLEHPNIVGVVDYGEDLVDHYLVMELAPGWKLEDSRTALDVGDLIKPLSASEVLLILKQVCEGLHYIHKAGIIHRDITPRNLLLFEGKHVKLADFGIARSREAVTMTMTGLSMGTPEYMSPEQAEGTRLLSPASDIYSLGVVTYEMLTGISPFKRIAPLATMHAHLYETPLPLTNHVPSISPTLQRIVMRCLDRNPKKRFPSAQKLYEALNEYEKKHT